MAGSSDRRAGRISSQESVPLCEQLDQIDVPGLEVRILPVQDYRFVALFRGEGLSEDVTETDPQVLDVPPRRVEAMSPAAEKTAAAANALIEGAREVLGDRDRANMVLLRGFSPAPAPSGLRRQVPAQPRRNCRLSHVPGAGKGRRHERHPHRPHV